VAWEWSTQDGLTGTVTINGVGYDPAAGRVFLASTQGGRVEVRQLPMDPSGVPAEGAGFAALAESDPDIARFVAAASQTERAP
jgi:hypothetical protein